MRFKKPENTDSPRCEAGEITWTKHSMEKMRFYNLSENRLKRVLRNPDRKEAGIAPETLAVMQRTGTKKHPTEIWMMYQIIKSKIKNPALTGRGSPNRIGRQKLKVISAWRYPGISPVDKEIPIPEDIKKALALNSEGF